MAAQDPTTKPLPPERNRFMQQSAAQARQVLESFSGDAVQFDSTALQLLDEWIDRMARKGPLSKAAQVLIIAFLGQVFLDKHGGYWATRTRGQKQTLGVVCTVAGGEDTTRFVNVSGQVGRRMEHGISESLAFFYLTTSVYLQI